MIKVVERKGCCGCATCVSACPACCITMEADCEGFVYPRVDETSCIGCGACERACPLLDLSGKAPALAAFAAKSNDDELRHESSSGGIFTELCRPVLDVGGVVYGVAMDENCHGCSFVRAETEDELAPMRGSKYIQASSLGVWERIRADCDAGRKVLFSGTPCQANALTRYLGGNRDGVLILDCVCHGVPSPELWAKCVADIEERFGRRVTSVRFRCKEITWEESRLRDVDADNAVFVPLKESSYMKLFLNDYCLRPSCYECKAKTMRLADITIADFWGIQDIVPEMGDRLGCSLVIMRTDVGMRALNAISDSISIVEVPYEDAVRGNRAEHSSVMRPPERDNFYSDLAGLGYTEVARAYGKTSIQERAKRIAKSVLSKSGLLDATNKLYGVPAANSMRYGMLFSFEGRRNCAETRRQSLEFD